MRLASGVRERKSYRLHWVVFDREDIEVRLALSNTCPWKTVAQSLCPEFGRLGRVRVTCGHVLVTALEPIFPAHLEAVDALRRIMPPRVEIHPTMDGAVLRCASAVVAWQVLDLVAGVGTMFDMVCSKIRNGVVEYIMSIRKPPIGRVQGSA